MQRPAATNAHLRIALQKAHILVRPDVYLAYSYFNALVAFLLGLILVVGVAVIGLSGFIFIPRIVFVFLVPLPLLLATTIYLLAFLAPDLRAGTRARDIDAKLPYALNYISTMAGGGVTPERIFSSLAEQRVYGEVANEMAWISRDLHVLGKDLLTALTAGIDRSPSVRFQDLLQGTITALSSGESIKDYFQSKSQQYVYENRQDQKKFIETLAVMAESYVTIVVAAPLFLIVILSVMLMFGANGQGVLAIGYLLILVLLPAAQFMFATTLKYITPEA